MNLSCAVPDTSTPASPTPSLMMLIPLGDGHGAAPARIEDGDLAERQHIVMRPLKRPAKLVRTGLLLRLGPDCKGKTINCRARICKRICGAPLQETERIARV